MKKLNIGISLFILLATGSYIYLSHSKKPLSQPGEFFETQHIPSEPPEQERQSTPLKKPQAPPPSTLQPTETIPQPDPRTFIVTADDYTITPGNVSVKKNTPVTLIFKTKRINVSGTLLFEGGGDSTKPLGQEQSDSLNFTAVESFDITTTLKSGTKAPYSLHISVQ